MARKFGIHDASWCDTADPAEAFEAQYQDAGVELLIHLPNAGVSRPRLIRSTVAAIFAR